MANVTIIPEDYDTLKKEYLILRKELDCVNQDLYGCKRQLKVVEALQNEYQSEIELLQSKEDAQNQKLLDKIGHLEDTVTSNRSKYNERVQILELELLKKNEESESLKAEIESLKKTISVQNSTDDIKKLVEEIIELKQKQETLLDNEDELKLSLEILQKNNLALEETLIKYREELSDVKESLSYKQHELCEANDLVQKLNDELFCLKSELESHRRKPLNEESKGNSLFAEVDDRRVYLQKTINNMKAEFLAMRQERAQHLNTISRLKIENRRLCARWKSDVEEKEEDEYMIVKAHKDRIEILEGLIEKYKQEVLAKPVVISNGTFAEIKFYEVMLKNKVKELEETREQLSGRSLTQILLATSLKEANKETRKWRLEANLRQSELELKPGDSLSESEVAEKLDEEMANQRVKLKPTNKRPDLACKTEERNIESKVKDTKTNELITSARKEFITINDSADDIQIIDAVEDTKKEEVVSIKQARERKEENINLSVCTLEFKEGKEGKTKRETKGDAISCIRKETSNSDEEICIVEDKDNILENKENTSDNECISQKPPRKVTFSENTASPKITDRSAMRRNCIRVVLPKPVFIP